MPSYRVQKRKKSPKILFPPEFKGGPGSGHHGHAGRKGKKGGSVPDAGGGSVDVSNDPNERANATIEDLHERDFEAWKDVENDLGISPKDAAPDVIRQWRRGILTLHEVGSKQVGKFMDEAWDKDKPLSVSKWANVINSTKNADFASAKKSLEEIYKAGEIKLTIGAKVLDLINALEKHDNEMSNAAEN